MLFSQWLSWQGALEIHDSLEWTDSSIFTVCQRLNLDWLVVTAEEPLCTSVRVPNGRLSLTKLKQSQTTCPFQDSTSKADQDKKCNEGWNASQGPY